MQVIRPLSGLTRAMLMAALALSSAVPTIGSGTQVGRPTSSNGDCQGCTLSLPPVTEFGDNYVSSENKVPIATIVVQPYTDGGSPTFYDQSMRPLSGAEVRRIVQSLPKDGVSALDLQILQPSDRVISAYGPNEPKLGFHYGDYYVRISWEKHRVSGCINKDIWHLGFMVKYKPTNLEIMNGHACVWWQNGPQFGFYNSANWWCATTRGTWTGIKDKIYGALRSVHVSYWASYVIAYVAADIVVFVFAL